MSDLVGEPNCWFSHAQAHFIFQAPAAFGLVSFLLHEGFDRPRIRKHLFIFAAAAPIGAIVTYFGLNQVQLLPLHHYIHL